MKTKSLLVVLLLVLNACHHALPKDSDGDDSGKSKELSFPESSAQLSKWVRTNVADFWRFEKEHDSLGSYADAIGVVVGDTHLANFAPIPVRLSDGSVQMRYLDIDFDDAGRAPFAYDFLRLVVTTKATKREAKVKEMVASYINGLTGGAAAPVPGDVQQGLALTADEYAQRLSDDLKGKVNDAGFKFKSGKIEPYTGPLTIAQIAPLLPRVQIIDLALRPVDDGTLRIWVYGQDSSCLRRLYELKQYTPSRLSVWGEQLPRAQWVDEVRRAMWPGVSPGEYELLEISGAGTFWLREKKLTMIDIPYSNSDKKAINYVRKLANYDAYVLGQIHARQASAQPLIARLRNPVDAGLFQEQIKIAAKTYLHSIAGRAF
jgi:hypothetical protein